MTRAVLANKQTMEVGEQIWQVTEKESYQEEEDQGVIMRRRMAEVWRLGELTVDRCLALPSNPQPALPCCTKMVGGAQQMFLECYGDTS